MEDEATALLMSRFYQSLAASPPLPPADALREARGWLRLWTDGRGTHPYTHPYAHPAYWAGFILIGAPAPAAAADRAAAPPG